MRDIQERRQFYRTISSRWLFFLLVVIGIWITAGALRAYVRARTLRAQEAALQTKQQMLKSQKSELEETLKGLYNGQGIEREAREQFFLKKPDEKAVIIVE